MFLFVIGEKLNMLSVVLILWFIKCVVFGIMYLYCLNLNCMVRFDGFIIFSIKIFFFKVWGFFFGIRKMFLGFIGILLK